MQARKSLRIFISPSQQPENIGVGDYGTEQQRMHELAWLVGAELVKRGHSPFIAQKGQKLAHVITFSDLLKVDLHLVLHSNALAKKNGAKLGVECFYYPGSIIGRKYAEAIYAAVGAINPHGKRRCVPNGGLWELAGTDAPAVYLEVGFHDDHEEARWIVENMGLIARTIAEAINKTAGKEV